VDRTVAEIAHEVASTASAAESGRQRSVPTGFPRDVRVEPDQSWLPDEIDAEALDGTNHFGQGVGRAAALRAVRVVYPDPDGPDPPSPVAERLRARRRRYQ